MSIALIAQLTKLEHRLAQTVVYWIDETDRLASAYRQIFRGCLFG
jgi:hypothetical protein